MVGAQDPMMGFPADLKFLPYGYFRNISGQPMKLSGQIFYAKGGQSASLPLPDTILAAHSSLSLPLQTMIQGLGLNGAITLVFSYSGQGGALLASTGSVDTSGNYVFAVPAHPSGQSAGKTSTFWTTAGGFDTMYSIWNPASQAQPLLATFQLGNGQTYIYPVTVPASGTAMIDLKEIAEMGAPDINGNKLPVSVTQGRISFSSASGKPADPMNVVVSGGIYNPTKAVCGYTCETCDGCTEFTLVPSPGEGTVGVLMQYYAQCPWTTGVLQDYTGSSSWSDEPVIISFESPGLGDPQDPGSTTVSAQWPLAPISMGQICTSPPLPNCQYVSPVVEAPTEVNPSVTIQVQNGFVGSTGNALVVMGNSGLTSTAITAQGSPAGGSVSWTVGPNLQINGANSINASLTGTGPSASYGDTWVQVTYTVNGQSASASTRCSVLNPTTLQVAGPLGGSQTTTAYQSGLNVGYVTTVIYYVWDQMSNEISLPGITLTEVLATTSNPFGVEFIPPDNTANTETSNSNGAMQDLLYAYTSNGKGLPSGFSASRAQSLTANGYAFSPVQQQQYTQAFATVATGVLSR